MFNKLKKRWKHLFFPYSDFTIEILTILNSAPRGRTLSQVKRECLSEPSMMGLKSVMGRLEIHEYIWANSALLSKPPQTVFTITELGKQILKERNFP